MAGVGVRELKEHLSQFLDRAERGELLLVTDRGRPKAVIGPVPGRARIEEGIAEGWLTPAGREGLAPVRRREAARRVLDVLGEDRGR